MSYELGIPKDQIPVMKRVLNLNDKQKEIILSQCHDYKPLKASQKFQPIEDFEDFPEIFDLVITLFKLYHATHDDQIFESVDDFLSQLTNSFIDQLKSENFQFENDFDDKFKSMKIFIKKILTKDSNLFYYEKAFNLLLERSRLMVSSRIITDIRPVFKEEKIEAPNYCVITHNLKIQYFKGLYEKKKNFYALDHQDLIHLQSQIERALEKEVEMQKFCQKAGLDILEV